MTSSDTAVMRVEPDTLRLLSLFQDITSPSASARKTAMQILMKPECDLNGAQLEQFRSSLGRIIENDLHILPDVYFWEVKNEISRLVTRVNYLLKKLIEPDDSTESKAA